MRPRYGTKLRKNAPTAHGGAWSTPTTTMRRNREIAVRALTRMRTTKYVTAALAITGAWRNTGFALPSPPDTRRVSRGASSSSSAATTIANSNVPPTCVTTSIATRSTSTSSPGGTTSRIAEPAVGGAARRASSASE